MLKTKGGQETIKSIPSDKILLETDAPFTKKMRTIRDMRAELEYTVERISEIRKEDVCMQIEENSAYVFGRVD